MITESDNAAADVQWDKVGRADLQRFLGLAGMTHTTLEPGILWGLTQATAPDELRLLTMLTSANPVLDQASRPGVSAGSSSGARCRSRNRSRQTTTLSVPDTMARFSTKPRWLCRNHRHQCSGCTSGMTTRIRRCGSSCSLARR